jgi:hypothetical protein
MHTSIGERAYLPRRPHYARTTLYAEGRLRGNPYSSPESSMIVVSHVSLPQRLRAFAAYTPVDADGVL